VGYCLFFYLLVYFGKRASRSSQKKNMSIILQYSTTTCNMGAPICVNTVGNFISCKNNSLNQGMSFQYSTSSCVTVESETVIDTATTTATTTTATSTQVFAYNGMTYGDIVISLFLFLILLGMFFGGLLNRLIGVKGKLKEYNKYDH
jgi:hypothetical protein